MITTMRVGKRRTTATLIVAALSIVVAPLAVATSAGASASPATALAQRLLDEAVIPTDAVQAHPATAVICQCAGTPGSQALTTRHQYYIVPGPPSSVERFLTTHIPQGGSFDGSVGTSSSSNGSPVTSMAITSRERSPLLFKAVGVLHEPANIVDVVAAHRQSDRLDPQSYSIANRVRSGLGDSDGL